MSEFDGKSCQQCGKSIFRIVQDEWMKRTFRFVETGQLKMCEECGAKYLVCDKCRGLYTRVHPALEAWELSKQCPQCEFVDDHVKQWDGVSDQHAL